MFFEATDSLKRCSAPQNLVHAVAKTLVSSVCAWVCVCLRVCVVHHSHLRSTSLRNDAKFKPFCFHSFIHLRRVRRALLPGAESGREVCAHTVHVLQQEECGCSGAAAWSSIGAGFLPLSSHLLSPLPSSAHSLQNTTTVTPSWTFFFFLGPETLPGKRHQLVPIPAPRDAPAPHHLTTKILRKLSNRGRLYKFGLAPVRGEAAVSQGADGRSRLPQNFTECCTLGRGAASFSPVQTYL